MWDDQIIDNEEMELLSFCYFFIGVLLPGFWGYLFINYSLTPMHYNNLNENCELLIDWSLVAGIIFIIHAFFYLIMSTFAFLGSRNTWHTKFIKIANFEDNYWRSFVLTFSLLAIFGMLGVLNKQYEQQFLLCGELYKLAEMFYYVFFSILASFAIIACLIQCSYENNLFDEEDEQQINESRRAQRRRRRQQQQQQQRNRLNQNNYASTQQQQQYQIQNNDDEEFQYNPDDFQSQNGDGLINTQEDIQEYQQQNDDDQRPLI